jgi:hypothetical protein
VALREMTVFQQAQNGRQPDADQTAAQGSLNGEDWRGNAMKLEEFIAGQFLPRYQYKSFEPVLVNHAWVWEDAIINTLLEKANRALGELNASGFVFF